MNLLKDFTKYLWVLKNLWNIWFRALQEGRIGFCNLKAVIHPEGRRPKGWIFTPEGWIRQPEGCKTQFFLTASAWKHISFIYICALVKFIPWDQFCNSFTQNFREINRMSTHQTNIWRKAIWGILTRLGWFDPPMGRVDQPK